MTKATGARERNRAALTRDIKEQARKQIAASGAQALSLRAVARELGLASSAVYRYFPSRDDLLTALIVDAYNAVGDAIDSADPGVTAKSGATPRERWAAVWRAVRAWAIANPHEYALIYGTPVPGYRAPQDTVDPGVRVPTRLVEIASAGRLPETPINDALRKQLDSVPVELPSGTLARVMVAWAQLFGMVSFELFGQFVGSAEPADLLFDFAAAHMADYVGL